MSVAMAGDTPDSPADEAGQAREAASATARHTKPAYESFAGPPASANAMPGGTENTAGGRGADLSVASVARTLKLEDFQKVHRQPCARDSLLLGISGGFGVGGVRAVLGGESLCVFSRLPTELPLAFGSDAA